MRVKRGVKARRRRKRLLAIASGFRGRSKNTIRQGRSRVDKSLTYRFRDRRVKKRDFRRLWITRINAAAHQNDMSYSVFMNGLRKAGIEVDRKVMADLAVREPAAFKALVEQAQAALK